MKVSEFDLAVSPKIDDLLLLVQDNKSVALTINTLFGSVPRPIVVNDVSDSLTPAYVTGSITLDVLTVTVSDNLPLAVDDVIFGIGVTTGTKITEIISVIDGVGEYRVDTSQTVAETTISTVENILVDSTVTEITAEDYAPHFKCDAVDNGVTKTLVCSAVTGISSSATISFGDGVGFSTVELNTLGSSVTIRSVNMKWYIVSSYNAVIT